MYNRRRFILGAGASLLLPRRRAFASSAGGGSTIDPYILPRLPGTIDGFNAFGGRTLVNPSSLSGSIGCIVFFGDSLCTNVVNSLYTPTQTNNYNFDIYNGGLYKSVEPLLGCNWNAITSGNLLTRLADDLITNSVYANVVLVPIALGGSLLADYASGGALNGIFTPTAARLAAAGLTVTGIHCALGGNDSLNGTSQSAATASMVSIVSTVRGVWASTPLFVATQSHADNMVYPAIQAALQSVWNSGNKVYDGGNTDSVTDPADYWDGSHPNATGAAAMASIIATAIAAHP